MLKVGISTSVQGKPPRSSHILSANNFFQQGTFLRDIIKSIACLEGQSSIAFTFHIKLEYIQTNLFC